MTSYIKFLEFEKSIGFHQLNLDKVPLQQRLSAVTRKDLQINYATHQFTCIRISLLRLRNIVDNEIIVQIFHLNYLQLSASANFVGHNSFFLNISVFFLKFVLYKPCPDSNEHKKKEKKNYPIRCSRLVVMCAYTQLFTCQVHIFKQALILLKFKNNRHIKIV